MGLFTKSGIYIKMSETVFVFLYCLNTYELKSIFKEVCNFYEIVHHPSANLYKLNIQACLE